jgi:hypothetical protein
MKIFNSKRTQTQILEAELAALNARAALLTGKRAACAASLDEARAAGQQHLLSGDVDDEATGKALQDRVGSVQSQLTGFDAALVALAVSVSETGQALAVEVHKVKCERDAAALGAITANLEKRFGPWLEATRAIAAGLEEVNGFRYQAAPLAGFYRHIAGEGEIALRTVLDDLNGAIGEVSRGERAITIGSAPPTPAVAAIPSEPPEDHFTYSTQKFGPRYQVQGGFTREK